MRLLLLLCPILSLAQALITQSAAVKGILMCGSRPAKGVLVKLYDEDTGIDDLLAAGRTDTEGYYELAGHTEEMTLIHPKLNVYHDCRDWMPCQRKFSVYIPDQYITEGEEPDRVFDAGVIQLSRRDRMETRDCFH